MQGRQKTLDQIKNMQARVKHKAPPFLINSYVGSYTNKLFGNIFITSMGNDLLIRFGNHRDLTATLQYMDSGEWLMTYNNPSFGIFPLRFNTDGNKVTAVTIKVNDFLETDPYVFTKL